MRAGEAVQPCEPESIDLTAMRPNVGSSIRRPARTVQQITSLLKEGLCVDAGRLQDLKTNEQVLSSKNGIGHKEVHTDQGEGTDSQKEYNTQRRPRPGL